MKITILAPRKEFTLLQQGELSSLGRITYLENRNELPLRKIVELSKDAEILGVDPDVFGGFEVARLKVNKLIETLPKLRGLALSSTSTEWIDLDYCRNRKIPVTNVPHYSTESVAEHVLGLLICLAKKIIINDRRVQVGREGQFEAGQGFELKGKTLGIIGLGSIGSRVAELGIAIGMKVVAYNRTPKKQRGIKIVPLNDLLSESDAISINLVANKETFHFISGSKIGRMKRGVIIVNLVGPVNPDFTVVDEKVMAEAIKEGRVETYAYEGEDLTHGPLAKLEKAIGLKGFAWYTKDALNRAMEIWTESIISIAKGKPINIVN